MSVHLLEHASQGVVLRPGVEDKSNNQSVQTQNFGENENENHSNEKPWLLCGTPDTGITDDADSETGSKTGETDRKTGTELDEPGVERHGSLDITRDQNGNDETVNGNNTGHNDGNDTLDEQVRAKDTHGRDTDTGL